MMENLRMWLHFDFAWNPEPEGGAMSFTFALNTDLSTALFNNLQEPISEDEIMNILTFNNGTADGETKTCALHEVVKFDEAFENTRLFF